MPTRHARRRAAKLLALALLAAGAACASPQNGGGDAAGEAVVDLRGSAVDLPTRPELVQIKALEVARSTGEGRLQKFLELGDPVVRRHAARALGRLPFPRYGDAVTVPLCEALSDADPQVRQEAAFALGIRGDRGARAILSATVSDPDPGVRAKVIEALTRLGSEDAVETVLRALEDPSPAVRQEAIVGLARWSRDDPRGAEVDARLVALLSPRRTEELPDSERWLVLYALQRRRSPAGAGAFLDHHRPGSSTSDAEGRENVNARLFAVRGLARLDPTGEREGTEPRPELTRALEEALDDPDWRIVVEAALGLGAHGDPASIEPLEAELGHDSPHVRRAVIQALGRFVGASAAVADSLGRGLADLSLPVRAESLVALARVLPADDALVTLQRMRSDGEEVVRAGVARAAALMPPPVAVELLEPLLRDARTFVSIEALRSLGSLADEAADARLRRELIEQTDLVLVQVAVEALGNRATAADLALLEERLEDLTGDSADELANTALDLAGRVGGEEGLELARRVASHPNPYLRARAAELVEALGGSLPEDLEPLPEPPPAEIPVAGVNYPLWRTNPIVAVDTNRGSMYFELYPGVAPVHVYNLLELAESGYYENTRFHRVELDFVIQGGDVRGDGAGGTSWRGDALGHEFSQRKFLRGSLGMPRWDDPDSGGAQIFVTHRPTPHLDGRYTLFGQLLRGWEVLDTIQTGDRIRGIRLLP